MPLRLQYPPAHSLHLLFSLLLSRSLVRDIVASLEKASGVELLQPDMRKLRESIVEGNWLEAGKALLRLPIEPLTRQACWFLLMQHKFLETIVDPSFSLEAKTTCLRRKENATVILTHPGVE